MSVEVFEKVIHDYSEMGGGYLSLTPVTGDVFLDKFLFQRLEITRKRYPAIREVGVTTNAVLIDRFSDAQVEAIAEAFDKLQISIYGLDKEEYFAMTKRNTYHRAIEGIRRLLRVRNTGTYLAFRLLKQRSRNEVEAWVHDTFRPRESVQINSIMTGGYANFTVLDTNQSLPFGDSWSSNSNNKTQCLIPLLAVQVCSSGIVAFCPCVGGVEGLVLGDIRNNTLLELYNTPRVRELWDWATFGVPESCAKCSFYAPLDSIRDDPSIIQDPFKWTGA
jgi:MoaA/NifB/PqqE/SkfB family radical SAM enzyme